MAAKRKSVKKSYPKSKRRSKPKRSSKRSKPKRSSKRSKPKRSGQKNNGMMTRIWGPAGWVFLHSCVMGYPVEIDKKDKKDVARMKKTKLFFNTIGHILPCVYCRESYNKFIKELPIDNFLSSRKKLAKWLYMIHNKVNKKLGVPKCDIPSFDAVYKRYEQYRAKCHKTTKKEAEKNASKGCVVPKNGKKRKCVIKIIDIK